MPTAVPCAPRQCCNAPQLCAKPPRCEARCDPRTVGAFCADARRARPASARPHCAIAVTHR
eukprot:5291305-Alexandrium_andersonii.AAC.1